MEGTRLSFLGNSREVPSEILSSAEGTEHDISPLARLKPPPNSPMLELSKLSHEYENALSLMRSHLVSELKNTSDVNSMITLANGTFEYLDSLEVDYLAFYEVVHTFISYHRKKEALEIQKKGPAFVTRACHHELASVLCDAELVQLRAHAEVKDVQQKIAQHRARTEELREQWRKAIEESEEAQKEVAEAEAEEVLCVAEYSRAEVDVIAIKPEAVNAEVIIDDVERRLKEAEAGIKEKSEELWLLRE